LFCARALEACAQADYGWLAVLFVNS